MTVIDLQRQVKQLRGEVPDERESRVALREEAHGVVLVVLGIMVGSRRRF